ncbi:BlaI/MecI/CopY family transcriptional regulator [Robiginitalea sp. SC105]|uniref:BlaI/MecI/CopY family transcriptional regulator n=1 Tax=Robiginitalea sp. SC105 TaxID=2762332 RepID=UPI00163A9C33|nr:BlaI/MecI/CopY family transcriptional regulator [Robiginitalea sp. SC105]MBC2838681.1 BlaI/MecI/CopY family transcriptional regulator [Robiginitalea sp. SC105]
MKLSRTEEALMNMLWERKRAFLKDLVEAHPEPRPAPTTIATLLKRMSEKGYVDYHTHGRSREYFPTVTKKAYFAGHFNKLISNFFNDSTAQFASFFTREADLSKEQLEELKALIEEEIKRK